MSAKPRLPKHKPDPAEVFLLGVYIDIYGDPSKWAKPIKWAYSAAIAARKAHPHTEGTAN